MPYYCSADRVDPIFFVLQHSELSVLQHLPDWIDKERRWIIYAEGNHSTAVTSSRHLMTACDSTTTEQMRHVAKTPSQRLSIQRWQLKLVQSFVTVGLTAVMPLCFFSVTQMCNGVHCSSPNDYAYDSSILQAMHLCQMAFYGCVKVPLLRLLNDCWVTHLVFLSHKIHAVLGCADLKCKGLVDHILCALN